MSNDEYNVYRNVRPQIEEEQNKLIKPKPLPFGGTFFTPFRILLIFTGISFLTYMDRGTFAASLDQIKTSFKISNLEGGIIGGAYLVSYTIASPIFAHFSHSYPPIRMIFLGLSIWAFCSAATGFAPELYSLLFVRALSGVGEASFLCLAPPFIDAFAPRDRRSVWLGIFYSSIPVGYAVGYIVGGAWIHENLFGEHWSWRSVFIFQGILMIPFILFCAMIRGPANMLELIPNKRSDTDSIQHTHDEVQGFAPEPPNGVNGHRRRRKSRHIVKEEYNLVEFNNVKEIDVHHSQTEWGRLMEEIRVLARNHVYIAISMGYATQTFVVGAFAFYGVEFVQKAYHYDVGTAGIVFGGITLFTGLFGTAMGGIVLDWYRGREQDETRSVTYACTMLTFLSALSLPAAVFAFVIKLDYIFFICIAVAELLLFAQISPINSAILWSIELQYRPFALAVTVIFIHMLGDAISPSIIGAILDATNENWNFSMLIGSAWLIFPILFFLLAWKLSVRKVKREMRLKLQKQHLLNVLDEEDYSDDEESNLNIRTSVDL